MRNLIGPIFHMLTASLSAGDLEISGARRRGSRAPVGVLGRGKSAGEIARAAMPPSRQVRRRAAILAAKRGAL